MRKSYPSDLTDAQWDMIYPLIPVSIVGRPRLAEMREVVNTIFYLVRSGCQWDMLPHDLPPKSTVYDYFAQWRDDGTWQRIVDALRQSRRKAAGKESSLRPPDLGTGVVRVSLDLSACGNGAWGNPRQEGLNIGLGSGNGTFLDCSDHLALTRRKVPFPKHYCRSSPTVLRASAT